MPTTTPDTLRSPNPSDPYNLVADLAIMQSDNQAALNRRANTYIGTSSQRTAFTSAANGTHWQDTNGNQWEWVRLGGAWVVSGPRVATGTGVTISAPGGGTTTSQSILFPSGLFTATPAVTIQNYSPLSTHFSVALRPSSVTTSGFALNVYNTSSSTITVTLGWIAAQGMN